MTYEPNANQTYWYNNVTVYQSVYQGLLQIMAFNYNSINGNMWDWGSNAQRSSSLTYSKQVVDGINYLFIVLPSVYDFGKNHFKCYDSLYQGMPLKPDSSSTPTQIYWDRKYAFFDIMSPDISINPVLTMPTLLLLADSGWYEVNLDYASPTNWGRFHGCGTFNKSLNISTCGLSVSEFAGPINKQVCSRDYKTKGFYDISYDSDFFDLCPVFRRKSAYFSDHFDCTDMNRTLKTQGMSLILQEAYGPNSRCFITTYSNVNLKLSESVASLAVPSCQKFKCAKSAGKYQLRIFLDNTWVDCPYYGGNVTLSLGKIH